MTEGFTGEGGAAQESGLRLALPPWLGAADRALRLAARRVRLIQAVTAINAAEEAARVERAFASGSPSCPRLRYDAEPVPVELCRALEKVGAFASEQGPLGQLYGARAFELALEAEVVAAVGTPKITKLAARRFVGETEPVLHDVRQADQLARTWAAAPLPEPLEPSARTRTCDAGDPRSLMSRMLAEVGRRRLAVRVVVEPGLASLAATGDGIVFVAAGKQASEADVERTVLHEIEGHVLPRVRAAAHPLGLFALGTARGVDDQEGRALILERAMGYLGPERQRELGLRHLAARATIDGADFVDVARLLFDLGCDIPDAVRIAMRVQRGGVALGGGIAREIVYLPALVRVERALAAHGAALEHLMASGRIAVDAAETLLYSDRGSAQQRAPVT